MPQRDYLHPVPSDGSGEVEMVQTDLAFDELPMSMWSAPVTVSEDLRQLHGALTDSLRRDARHLPSGVVAALQLERLSTLYILIRFHEINNSWPSGRYQEWIYKTWRALAKDVAEAGHSTKMSPEQLHQIVSSHTAKIVATVLQSLPQDQSKPLFKKFAEALEEETA